MFLGGINQSFMQLSTRKATWMMTGDFESKLKQVVLGFELSKEYLKFSIPNHRKM
jgi:hypothetical protein